MQDKTLLQTVKVQEDIKSRIESDEDFLTSWKSIKVAEGGDFDFGTLPSKTKGFKLDKLDFNFNGPSGFDPSINVATQSPLSSSRTSAQIPDNWDSRLCQMVCGNNKTDVDQNCSVCHEAAEVPVVITIYATVEADYRKTLPLKKSDDKGKSELVIQIGKGLLQERLPKSLKQDIVLAMALAYVDQSRDAMAFSPLDVIRSCEMLERSLKLLQEEGATSLAPDLQKQIDETLEEITPCCVVEHLVLPLTDKNRIRREEGLQRVLNILGAVGGGGAAAIAGGFTRDEFMRQAFLYMTASEQVDLFFSTPPNIPAESFEFYEVALAYVAQAVELKKPQLIQDADKMFLQLQQTKITRLATDYDSAMRSDREKDFALERGLCALLLGDVAFSVPNSLVVTLDRVLGNETIAELMTTNKLSELACLALYLMYEKKQGKNLSGILSSGNLIGSMGEGS